MHASETALALARAWLALQPYRRLYPKQCEDLARRAMDCRLQLQAERSSGAGVVVDLEAARAARLCDQLLQAVRDGVALPIAFNTPASAAEQALTAEILGKLERPAAEPRAVSVSEHAPGTVLVSVRGYVTAEDLHFALARLGPTLDREGCAVLVDAQHSRGHEARCGRVLEEWLAARGGKLPFRVAAVVQRGMQFVRASRALAAAHGTNWLITQERAVAERWLASDLANAN